MIDETDLFVSASHNECDWDNTFRVLSKGIRYMSPTAPDRLYKSFLAHLACAMSSYTEMVSIDHERAFNIHCEGDGPWTLQFTVGETTIMSGLMVNKSLVPDGLTIREFIQQCLNRLSALQTDAVDRAFASLIQIDTKLETKRSDEYDWVLRKELGL